MSRLQEGICVVGSANVDLIAKLDRMPAKGETIKATSSAQCCGGKGANQAIMAARMGVPTKFIAKIGKDSFGDKHLQALAEDGIDASHVYRDPKACTGLAMISVDPDGQNTIVVLPGANETITAEEIRQAEPMITGSRVLLTQLEASLEATTEALRIAKNNGVLSILNTAPATENLNAELLRLADVICPNETELSILTDMPAEALGHIREAAKMLLRTAHGGKVIVTLGERGALLVSEEDSEELPCPKVPHVLDTTGAGDCFLGSLASYLATGVSRRNDYKRAARLIQSLHHIYRSIIDKLWRKHVQLPVSVSQEEARSRLFHGVMNFLQTLGSEKLQNSGAVVQKRRRYLSMRSLLTPQMRQSWPKATEQHRRR